MLKRLSRVTEEEQAILDGRTEIDRGRYTDQKDMVVDCEKLLEKGRLIQIRPHTRFAGRSLPNFGRLKCAPFP